MTSREKTVVYSINALKALIGVYEILCLSKEVIFYEVFKIR